MNTNLLNWMTFQLLSLYLSISKFVQLWFGYYLLYRQFEEISEEKNKQKTVFALRDPEKMIIIIFI